jgi:hypothetical protein
MHQQVLAAAVPELQGFHQDCLRFYSLKCEALVVSSGRVLVAMKQKKNPRRKMHISLSIGTSVTLHFRKYTGTEGNPTGTTRSVSKIKVHVAAGIRSYKK